MIPEKIESVDLQYEASFDDVERAAIEAEIVRRYNGYADQQKEIKQLRVQLAGCGVAAMQNTTKSIKQRAKKGVYGWSASYQDVCDAIDREMKLRGENAGQQALIEQMVEACDEMRRHIDSTEDSHCMDYCYGLLEKALAAAKKGVENETLPNLQKETGGVFEGKAL